MASFWFHMTCKLVSKIRLGVIILYTSCTMLLITLSLIDPQLISAPVLLRWIRLFIKLITIVCSSRLMNRHVPVPILQILINEYGI